MSARNNVIQPTDIIAVMTLELQSFLLFNLYIRIKFIQELILESPVRVQTPYDFLDPDFLGLTC